MVKDKTEGVFRPILSLSVNWQSTFCLTISTLGKDSYSEFYFDDEMLIIPELSTIQSSYSFMNDALKKLADKPRQKLFPFIQDVFLESGLSLPALPPKHIRKAIGDTF